VVEEKRSELTGKRIVVTRALAQSEGLFDALRSCGAEVVLFPLIKTSPAQDFGALDDGLKSLREGDWIFLTSQNAVGPVVRRSGEFRRDLLQGHSGIQIAVVGPASERSARDAGLNVNYVAKTHDGVSLAQELGERLGGRRVLLPRSDRASSDLPDSVRGYGGEALEAVAYRTGASAEWDEETLAMIAAGNIDAIVCFSPSAVHALVKLLGSQGFAKLQGVVTFAAIGEVTAKAYREAGVQEPLVAADASVEAVVEVLSNHYAGRLGKVFAGAKKT
jgi:uroporphyrinogen III methyltransferase / synthase